LIINKIKKISSEKNSNQKNSSEKSSNQNSNRTYVALSGENDQKFIFYDEISTRSIAPTDDNEIDKKKI